MGVRIKEVDNLAELKEMRQKVRSYLDRTERVVINLTKDDDLTLMKAFFDFIKLPY